MKLIPIAIFMLTFYITEAQQNFVWTEVVKVDSVSQKDLYSNAKIWIAKVYGSAKDVIQMMDDNTCTIVAKGAHEIGPQIPARGSGFSPYPAGFVHYTLTIECKDGRYKYTIDQCYHKGNSKVDDGGSLSNDLPADGFLSVSVKFWRDKLKPDFVENTTSLIGNLKIAMAKKSTKSDW